MQHGKDRGSGVRRVTIMQDLQDATNGFVQFCLHVQWWAPDTGGHGGVGRKPLGMSCLDKPIGEHGTVGLTHHDSLCFDTTQQCVQGGEPSRAHACVIKPVDMLAQNASILF